MEAWRYTTGVGTRSQDLRSGQQRRTHAALLQATSELLRAGKTPSVAEAAEAADVSRRTAYRYFPTQEQLLTEAALETLRPGIESAFALITDDPEARLEAAVRAMQDQTAINERLLRTMMRLTVERGATLDEEGVAQPARGRRRIDWIESALAPLRSKVAKSEFSRLVSAISLCVGAEALIVLRDIRGLDQRAAQEISVWSARALLRATLSDAKRGKASPAKSVRR